MKMIFKFILRIIGAIILRFIKIILTILCLVALVLIVSNTDPSVFLR